MRTCKTVPAFELKGQHRGRVHTVRLKKTASRLKGCHVYKRSDARISAGKSIPVNGE